MVVQQCNDAYGGQPAYAMVRTYTTNDCRLDSQYTVLKLDAGECHQNSEHSSMSVSRCHDNKVWLHTWANERCFDGHPPDHEVELSAGPCILINSADGTFVELEGTQGLTGGGMSSQGMTLIVVGASSGGGVILCLVLAYCYCKKRRARTGATSQTKKEVKIQRASLKHFDSASMVHTHPDPEVDVQEVELESAN